MYQYNYVPKNLKFGTFLMVNGTKATGFILISIVTDERTIYVSAGLCLGMENCPSLRPLVKQLQNKELISTLVNNVCRLVFDHE